MLRYSEGETFPWTSARKKLCVFSHELWVTQNLTEIAGVSRVVKSHEELRSDFSRELLICVVFFFQILKWPKAKNALPESNIAPENRKLVFQASIFRCELLVSGRAVSPPRSCPLHPLICPKIGSPARSFNLFRCLKREIRYHWINASSRMLSIQTSHQVGAGYEHPLNHFRLGWLESSHDIDIITSHYGLRFRSSNRLGGAAKSKESAFEISSILNNLPRSYPIPSRKTITYPTKRKSGTSSTPKKCLWMGGIRDRSLEGTPFSLQRPRSWLKNL